MNRIVILKHFLLILVDAASKIDIANQNYLNENNQTYYASIGFISCLSLLWLTRKKDQESDFYLYIFIIMLNIHSCFFFIQ